MTRENLCNSGMEARISSTFSERISMNYDKGEWSILLPQALRGDYVRGRAQRGHCSWQALGRRPPFVVGCCKWLYEEAFGWGIMLKLKGEIILTIKSCYWLGNIKRMKIGKTGKLAEARDVVVGEVQVGQSHQVRETLGENIVVTVLWNEFLELPTEISVILFSWR